MSAEANDTQTFGEVADYVPAAVEPICHNSRSSPQGFKDPLAVFLHTSYC